MNWERFKLGASQARRDTVLTRLTFHLRERKVVEEIQYHNHHLNKLALREKFQVMSESPYRFYQGTNHLFWHDFYNDWRLSLFGGVECTQTWLQGNTHVYNFGAFPGRDGKAALGMDDFDEAIVGDYQYDLWSLGISIVLNCSANGYFNFEQAGQSVRIMAKAYWKTIMQHVLDKPINLSKAPEVSRQFDLFLKKIGSKKRIKQFYNFWIEELSSNSSCFNPNNQFIESLKKRDKELFLAVFADYQRDTWYQTDALKNYQVFDIAHRKYFGNGVDEVDHYFVLIGNGEGYHILDVKEQHLPCACFYMTDEELKRYRQIFPNEGFRHEQAFNSISNHMDPFIGWIDIQGRLYSIREKSPLHQDFSTQKIRTFKDYLAACNSWGKLLACEHLRGARALFGQHGMPFAQSFAVVAENKKVFLNMVQDISESYANCVVNDYEVFLTEFASEYI